MARKKLPIESNRHGIVRAVVFSAVACVTGLVAIFGMHGLIRSYQVELEKARQPEDTVMVMVAARDLFQGITITEADLYAVEIPPRYLPEDVYLNPDHVVGRVPRERILANELVRSDRLADPEAGRGLNAVIPRGLRAISVDLANGRALAGLLQPGNHVDVLVTIDPEDRERTTRTILQSVFVLGVDSKLQDEHAEAGRHRGRHQPSVTLLVTSDHAESVAYADALGDLTLALRSSDDLDSNDTIGDEGVTLAQLRRQVAPVAAPPRRRPDPPPELGTLTIYRGPDGREYKIDAEGNVVD